MNERKILTLTGKVAGTLYPDEKVFLKKVKRSKHLFQKLTAWGIDAEILADILVPKGIEIRVWDTENNLVYWIKAEKWLEEGSWLHFKGVEDSLAQVFLPLEKFEVKRVQEVKTK